MEKRKHTNIYISKYKKKQKKRCVILSCTCLFLLSGITIHNTTSYFIDNPGQLDNLFTGSSLQIELTEPNWKESDAAHMHPLETVRKNPLIRNTGTVPAYVFLQIDIPVKTIRTVDTNGKKTEAVPTELFMFEADRQNWNYIDTQERTESVRYIYGYKEILYPEEQTTALFETVTSVNYLEGELDPEDLYMIDIQAKAIQSQIDAETLSMSQIYDLLADTSSKTGGVIQ